jgi:hypothetical protein
MPEYQPIPSIAGRDLKELTQIRERELSLFEKGYKL